MKELDQHLKKQERVEIVAAQQKQHQKLLTGKIMPKRGHTVWEINKETLDIKEAKYQNHALKYELAAIGDFSRLADLIMEEGFIYIPALNKENALKKYNNNPNQSHYFYKQPIAKLNEHF